MADYKSMCATTEPSICDERDRFTQTCADNGSCGFQHFRHTRCTFGTFIADNNNISGFNATTLNSYDQFLFTIKYSCRSGKTFAFLSANFCDTATFSKVAV